MWWKTTKRKLKQGETNVETTGSKISSYPTARLTTDMLDWQNLDNREPNKSSGPFLAVSQTRERIQCNPQRQFVSLTTSIRVPTCHGTRNDKTRKRKVEPCTCASAISAGSYYFIHHWRCKCLTQAKFRSTVWALLGGKNRALKVFHIVITKILPEAP
jgi:hypothetical protein